MAAAPLPRLALVALAMGTLLAWRGDAPRPAANRTVALVALLSERGLSTSTDDVTWIDPPPRGPFTAWLGRSRALVRGRAHGMPHDLYLVRARLSPEGVLLGGDLHALTRTDAADEGRPIVIGERAFYTRWVNGIARGIHQLDLAGEAREPLEQLGPIARAQHALTNLQESGQFEGIGRRAWELSTPAGRVELSASGAEIVADADGRIVRIEASGGAIVEGAEHVRAKDVIPGAPGNLLTWATDRARQAGSLGDERVQKLKAATFEALDLLRRAHDRVRPDAAFERIAHELGPLPSSAPRERRLARADWPPAPMAPLLSPALPGEGAFTTLDADPFVSPSATVQGSSPLAIAFLRPDRERAYARVYVMLWDPRRLSLHMVAGTNEPIGVTGERGSGLIPRDPKVLGRVVAAMNGGFQTIHGSFGMMADGVVYLPPKPFAATILSMRDGSTGFGTWPLETRISDDVLAFRQNLSPLVLDGIVNPYGRQVWGGTSPDTPDEIHTVRTGLCLTEEGFVAYFHGNETRPETLASAMLAARCSYGVHLDMNHGHSGLELYRMAPEGELPPLDRPLQGDWEAEGSVEGLSGWSFRARKMFRGMGLMNFPRYARRESRDFFYLMWREPGPAADDALEMEEPKARRIFEDTPIVPPELWRSLQMRR